MSKLSSNKLTNYTAIELHQHCRLDITPFPVEDYLLLPSSFFLLPSRPSRLRGSIILILPARNE